jgi:hypothetical protein
MIVLLLSCQQQQEVSTARFSALWQESYNNTAATWWYLGEDEAYFFLEEKTPVEVRSYKVPKDSIELIDINRVKHGKSEEPVNLKVQNVEFM